jgi:hypothetical protein
MEQKFVKFEEAVDKLGITAERLNQLREDGELRAYRDGGSWKFRADEIDRLASDGLPEPSPPSDIGLVDPKDLVDAEPLKGLDDLEELSLAEEDELSLGGSELELAPDQEDTVTAGASDAALNIHSEVDEGSDPSDSILLSEEALGESAHAPSTIIGRSEIEGADLELVTEEDDVAAGASDVALSAGASNVLSAGVAGSGVLDDLEKESGATSAFENLEELEIDLAAESSRILKPEDIAEAKPKGNLAQKQTPEGDSDLTLDDGLLADDDGTDPVPEEIRSSTAKAKKAEGPTSDLELATDEDDFVLAEAGGSDITLDSGDSGINLISPSDSGLALDDIPLEIGGSAILESLSLGDKGPATSDLSLVGSDPRLGRDEPLAKLQTDDDFRLTPLGDKDDDGDSSSQVIPVDADLGDMGAGDGGILGDDAFAEDDGVVLAEDYGPAGEVIMAPAYATAARAEGEYSVWNIVGLGSCMLLLLFAVVLMLDMVRNIWSWDANLALNDSLLDSLLGLFGLQ